MLLFEIFRLKHKINEHEGYHNTGIQEFSYYILIRSMLMLNLFLFEIINVNTNHIQSSMQSNSIYSMRSFDI